MATFELKAAEREIEEAIGDFLLFIRSGCTSELMEEHIAAAVVSTIQRFSHDCALQQTLLQRFVTGSRERASELQFPSIDKSVESTISLATCWLNDPLSYEDWLWGDELSDWAEEDDEFDDDEEFEPEEVETFWQPTVLESEFDFDEEGRLIRGTISEEQVLAAIRQQHQDSEKYPYVECIGMQGDIVEIGFYRVAILSNRGVELVPLWVVPKPPASS